MRNLVHRFCVAFLVILVSSALAHANEEALYPNRTVRLVVSAPPGGGVDTTARIFADQLQQRWKQPVIVENRPGASGNLAAEAVAAAPPDGYTLLVAMPPPFTISKILYKKLNFDPARLEPIAVLTEMPNALAIRSDFPADTMMDFIAYAKRNPGRITFASQGVGATAHLTSELLAQMLETRFVHVPYKGTAQATTDLIAGHVDMFFLELVGAIEVAKTNKVKIIAVATEARAEALPRVPTMKELGLPEVLSSTWHAMAAPPATPPAIAQKINHALNEIIVAEVFRERLRAIGLQAVGGSREHMAKVVGEETLRWTRVIEAAHITLP